MRDGEAIPVARPFIRAPLATPAELLREPAAFPVTTDAEPLETGFADWRQRLQRNLSRRTDGRWEPLTHVHCQPSITPAALDARPEDAS